MINVRRKEEDGKRGGEGVGSCMGHVGAWQGGAGSPEVCRGTHHHKLCLDTGGTGESPDAVRVAENDQGRDGAHPHQVTLGVVGHQLSYFAQAPLHGRGGTCEQGKGHHSAEGESTAVDRVWDPAQMEGISASSFPLGEGGTWRLSKP